MNYMMERYFDAWIQLDSGDWYTADIPESTIYKIRKAAELKNDGFFSGEVYFRNAINFHEGQHVKMKDLLVVEVNGQK